jgi:hypothetical protein
MIFVKPGYMNKSLMVRNPAGAEGATCRVVGSGIDNVDPDSYISKFAEHKDVKQYFDALKSGNQDAIKNSEAAYRVQVGELAKKVQGIYGQSDH